MAYLRENPDLEHYQLTKPARYVARDSTFAAPHRRPPLRQDRQRVPVQPKGEYTQL
jgi:hypothetical protein